MLSRKERIERAALQFFIHCEVKSIPDAIDNAISFINKIDSSIKEPEQSESKQTKIDPYYRDEYGVIVDE